MIKYRITEMADGRFIMWKKTGFFKKWRMVEFYSSESEAILGVEAAITDNREYEKSKYLLYKIVRIVKIYSV